MNFMPGTNVMPGVTWMRPLGPSSVAAARQVHEPSALRLNALEKVSMALPPRGTIIAKFKRGAAPLAPSAGHKDWQAGMREHPVRLAAQEQAAQRAAPVRRHGDRIAFR